MKRPNDIPWIARWSGVLFMLFFSRKGLLPQARLSILKLIMTVSPQSLGFDGRSRPDMALLHGVPPREDLVLGWTMLWTSYETAMRSRRATLYTTGHTGLGKTFGWK